MRAVVKICRNIAKKPAYFPYILTYIEGLKYFLLGRENATIIG